ncbi:MULTISPECIES: hypothetical protein [Myxococcaceae]|uniref:hypothetical protein n=1 Tax=Myxococcaceae TaxID=31 RepID=UPI0018903CC8|nr:MULTISPECIES: hypothetical protein [Myxococcaceae]MBF5046542.1 hypothetical protein [Simulacricoccus sp. 17bor-14]
MRTLYRPVGLRELELILDADARAFPPRLPDQPVFYPVLNEGYAVQIARDWNTPDAFSGYAGFVTAFDLEESFLARYERKVVGASQHEELWVPAEELREFNERIVARIRVTRAFYGERYEGPQPPSASVLQGRDPRGQLRVLGALDAAALAQEVERSWKLVLANHGFWSACAPAQQGLSEAQVASALGALREAWGRHYTALPLPPGELAAPR